MSNNIDDENDLLEEEEVVTTPSKLIQNDDQLKLAAQASMSITQAEDRKNAVTPVDIVENSVAVFLNNCMDASVDSHRLAKALDDDLISSLPTMTTAEKITLKNITASANNDNQFKILSPSIGLLTARQQALIQANAKEAQAAAVQVNVNAGNSRDASIASSVSPEVAAGLNTIFQLLAARQADLQSKSAQDDDTTE